MFTFRRVVQCVLSIFPSEANAYHVVEVGLAGGRQKSGFVPGAARGPKVGPLGGRTQKIRREKNSGPENRQPYFERIMTYLDDPENLLAWRCL